MRLIDADAAKSIVYISPPAWGRERDLMRVIDSVPTIDAEPVRHGRWEVDMRMCYKAYPPYEYKRGYKCSLCGRETRSKNEPYCHCGAKMDLGVQE